jgi:hypothetical protein
MVLFRILGAAMMGAALYYIPDLHGWDRAYSLFVFLFGLNEWRASFTPEKDKGSPD